MPFRRVEIRTPLPVETVRDRIRQKVRPATTDGFWERLEAAIEPAADPSTFRGTVSENEFKIRRVIRYRNSFLPVIRGQLSTSVGGNTTIRLTMTLHVFAAAFMVFWLGSVAMAVPWQMLGQFESIDTRVLIPLGMVLFGIVLTITGFYPEARKAERILRDAVAP